MLRRSLSRPSPGTYSPLPSFTRLPAGPPPALVLPPQMGSSQVCGASVHHVPWAAVHQQRAAAGAAAAALGACSGHRGGGGGGERRRRRGRHGWRGGGGGGRRCHSGAAAAAGRGGRAGRGGSSSSRGHSGSSRCEGCASRGSPVGTCRRWADGWRRHRSGMKKQAVAVGGLLFAAPPPSSPTCPLHAPPVHAAAIHKQQGPPRPAQQHCILPCSSEPLFPPRYPAFALPRPAVPPARPEDPR